MPRSAEALRYVEGWLVIGTAILALACEQSGPRVEAGNDLPPGVPHDTINYERAVAQYPIGGPDNTRDRKRDCWYYFCGNIPVNIRARGDHSAVDPLNPPTTAVPVAHIVNTDKHEREKWYTLLPSDSAWYDLWVYKDPKTQKAVWALVEMSHTADAVTAAKPTRFALCNKDGTYTKPEADFASYKHKECAEKLDAESERPTASLSISGLLTSFISQFQALSAASRTGGGWIDCPNGCCT
jgi:hypothetical protein